MAKRTAPTYGLLQSYVLESSDRPTPPPKSADDLSDSADSQSLFVDFREAGLRKAKMINILLVDEALRLATRANHRPDFARPVVTQNQRARRSQSAEAGFRNQDHPGGCDERNVPKKCSPAGA